MSLTSDPNDPRIKRGPPDETPVEQHDTYLVLTDEELAKGFVRPVRNKYIHSFERGGCGAVTTMGRLLSETYAAQPTFYSSTFCCGCSKHRPVGVDGEFIWEADHQAVGS